MSLESKFPPIEQFPAPLRHVVTARLRAAITSGHLKPGDRLVEARLSKALMVSRPSLREAMRQIEAEGLIDIVPNVGPVVRELTLDQIKQACDLLGAVEALCARYFAKNGTAKQIEAFERSIDMLEIAASKNKDYEEIIKAKRIYYDAFLDGSGSELCQTYARQLLAVLSYYWGMSLRKPGRPAEGLGEMRRLLEAIRAREPELAASASLTHTRHAADTVLFALASTDLKPAKRADATPRKTAK